MAWTVKNAARAKDDPVGYDQALVALATYRTLEEAQAHVEGLGGHRISIKALEVIQRNEGPEIERVRKELAPKLEQTLTLDLGDEGRMATAIIDLALQRTQERLKRNDISEPWKVAREVSQVRTQAVDKKLALEGRPTTITERRDMDEVVRALEGMGVAKQIEVTVDAESTEG